MGPFLYGVVYLRINNFLEAVTLSITKETEIIEDENEEIVLTEIQEGDVYYPIYLYEAEAEQAIDLVEGEKVYVLETPNSDWWFVKKHLTEEKGWVPAKILLNETKYTAYVQRRLNEKIDKLPVFESKYKLCNKRYNNLIIYFQNRNRKKHLWLLGL